MTMEKRRPRPQLTPKTQEQLREKRFQASAQLATQYAALADVRDHHEADDDDEVSAGIGGRAHRAKSGETRNSTYEDDLDRYLWRDRRGELEPGANTNELRRLRRTFLVHLAVVITLASFALFALYVASCGGTLQECWN